MRSTEQALTLLAAGLCSLGLGTSSAPALEGTTADAEPRAAEPGPQAPGAEAALSSPPSAVVAQPAILAPSPAAFPFQVSVVLNESMGAGTLVQNRYARDPTFSTLLIWSIAYPFELRGLALKASARQILPYETTKPDNSAGRRFDPGDIFLGLLAPKAYVEPRTGIELNPGLRLTVPASVASRGSSSYTNATAALGLSRRLAAFDLSLGLLATKGFYRYTSRVATAQDAASYSDPEGLHTVICRQGFAACKSGGMNTSFSFTTSLAVAYRPIEPLKLEASYLLINKLNYAAAPEVDAYTPKALDSTGRPVVKAGMGRSDVEWGVLDVEYTFTENLALALGSFTLTPPLTADNQSLRNPFLDFRSYADNLTSYYVELRGHY